jgi:hypothetical protein
LEFAKRRMPARVAAQVGEFAARHVPLAKDAYLTPKRPHGRTWGVGRDRRRA